MRKAKQWSNLKSDAAAGFVVFLVALPLCLGIALASGAPIVAGMISAIVAGIVVSWLSGSELSVSGPAAGLTVIVSSGIAQVGSWSAFLAVTVIAGVIQAILGLLKGGRVAAFFPNSVIKGMLAAIGLTIIFKQIPHALGWDADFEGDESFLEEFSHHGNTFRSLVESLHHVTMGAVIVSCVAAAIIIVWGLPLIRQRRLLAMIPAPLVAILGGAMVNHLLQIVVPSLALSSDSGHFVTIPGFSTSRDMIQYLTFPDFSVLGRHDVWFLALTVALVASIESLLSVEAVDRIDPERRSSDASRELVAQGIGNILNGLIGGLVMTSVIVRSSANIYAGGKTRWSSFFHGLFMLLSVLLFGRMLNQIPLAALAIVLISIGLKLINPAIIRSVWTHGLEQFGPFLITIMAIVMTDLLTGVAIGLGVALLVIVRMNHTAAITVVNDGNLWLIRFAKDVSFAHKANLKQSLASLPNDCAVLIDGAGANFIDFDIMEEIEDFLEVAPRRGIKASWRNLRSKRLTLRRSRQNGKLQDPAFSE